MLATRPCDGARGASQARPTPSSATDVGAGTAVDESSRGFPLEAKSPSTSIIGVPVMQTTVPSIAPASVKRAEAAVAVLDDDSGRRYGLAHVTNANGPAPRFHDAGRR